MPDPVFDPRRRLHRRSQSPFADLTALVPLLRQSRRSRRSSTPPNTICCLRRDYGFEFANLFDTSRARTLGWPQVGLAAILDTNFGVANKRYQRADWTRPRSRPAARLRPARHALLACAARTAAAALSEAAGCRRRRVRAPGAAAPRSDTERPDPAAFWRVKGARELTRGRPRSLTCCLSIAEQQAERIDCPPFKVMGEPTLSNWPDAPASAGELHGIPGLHPSDSPLRGGHRRWRTHCAPRPRPRRH